MLDELKNFQIIYLATPYTKYPRGIGVAFRDAARIAGRLMIAGIKIYSPISHGHPLSVYGGVHPKAHDIWLPFDEAMMAKADALLVAKMETWESSFGIAHEIRVFKEAGKPIYYIEPETLAVSNAA